MSVVFTCSFDDGHPSDMKMADLLEQHGLNGTFYLPIKNRAGLDVLSTSQVRELATRFEIGSHTQDHSYLIRESSTEARRQITDGKMQLEDVLGKEVPGFCYPGGRYRPEHIAMVRTAGFKYARTTMNLRFDAGDDPFIIPATIQFYPHVRAVYLRNFISSGKWSNRIQALGLAFRHRQWISRLYALLDSCIAREGQFHLWGHSWEIDRLDAWHELDGFLAYAASQVKRENRLTNGQLASRVFNIDASQPGGAKRPVILRQATSR